MWYTNKNEACAAASSSQQVWNAAQEKSESGRVDFLELEQAKQRVEELRKYRAHPNTRSKEKTGCSL